LSIEYKDISVDGRKLRQYSNISNDSIIWLEKQSGKPE
jgi:hypothetical protein